RRAPVKVTPPARGRLAPAVETAAYFCCLEAVQNAAKHSGAATIRVELRQVGGSLECVGADDSSRADVGTTAAGTGLTSMRYRIEAVGGTLATRSTPDLGTRV